MISDLAIARLTDEHGVILKVVDGLLARFDAADDSMPPKVRRDLDAFAERFTGIA